MIDHLKELLCCYSEPLAVLGCFYKELVDFHARTKKNEKTACDLSRIETTCSPPQLTNVKPQPLGHTNNIVWASTIKQTRIHFCIIAIFASHPLAKALQGRFGRDIKSCVWFIWVKFHASCQNTLFPLDWHVDKCLREI